MITAKIGRRGQLILPKEIRKLLAVEEGQRVAFVIKGGQVVLQPLTKTIFDLRGTVPVDHPQDFEAIRLTVRQQHTEKLADPGDDDES